jgi:lipopolysaccharide export system ATP-binding protein
MFFCSLSHRNVSVCNQEPSVFRGLSVRDNIRLILQETGLEQDAHNLRIEELLEEFCLQDVGNTVGRALSGGERRRTELARALASNCAYGGPPKIVLIDEPFAGVDPIGVTGIQKQLRRLCEVMGMGILITDHNVNETLRICERAYMVHNGQVLASGKPDEILQDRYVQQHYLGREFRGW